MNTSQSIAEVLLQFAHRDILTIAFGGAKYWVANRGFTKSCVYSSKYSHGSVNWRSNWRTDFAKTSGPFIIATRRPTQARGPSNGS